jgi:hypothetical protein
VTHTTDVEGRSSSVASHIEGEFDVIAIAHLTRLLDQLHAAQTPIDVLLANLNPPLQHTPVEGSPLYTLQPLLFHSTSSQNAAGDGTLSWLSLSDSLSRHLVTSFYINQRTGNIHLPLRQMVDTISEAWVQAMCFMVCRSMKRAFEAQGECMPACLDVCIQCI